jgi:hypothetical protein
MLAWDIDIFPAAISAIGVRGEARRLLIKPWFATTERLHDKVTFPRP